MMKRTKYDLSHLSLQTYKIGRLQTLSQIPVMANDSIKLHMGIIVRQAALRREIVADPIVDIFAFFVPHRHIYDQWIEFIRQGVDETINLPTFTPAGQIQYTANYSDGGDSIPLHAHAGYNRIWNRYFRVPSDNSTARGYGVLADTAQANNTNYRKYGHVIARTKNWWNTALEQDQVTSEDYSVPIVNGTLDVRALEQYRARYGSETARDWFANADERYKDVMQLAWGTGRKQRTNIIYRSGNKTKPRQKRTGSL